MTGSVVGEGVASEPRQGNGSHELADAPSSTRLSLAPIGTG
jgi:hypothetical protein